MDLLIVLLVATVQSSVPLMLAGMGELVGEKSGVLNLGIEGIMLVGAVSAFVVAIESESFFLGIVMAISAGVLMAAGFAFLTLVLRANQIASGLALSIFGVGLSAFIGLDYVGETLKGLGNVSITYLSDISVIGQLFFQYNWVVYLAFLLLILTHYFLYYSHLGLVLRAIGENHDIAHMMGYCVLRVRACAVLFGGASAGLAGAYLSLVYTPLWSENMTAGRGWIAVVLVVFAMWRPLRLLFGALLFGLVSIAQLFLQGEKGVFALLPTQLLTALPYISTIVVLVLISSVRGRKSANVPASLGQIFEPK